MRIRSLGVATPNKTKEEAEQARNKEQEQRRQAELERARAEKAKEEAELAQVEAELAQVEADKQKVIAKASLSQAQFSVNQKLEALISAVEAGITVRDWKKNGKKVEMDAVKEVEIYAVAALLQVIPEESKSTEKSKFIRIENAHDNNINTVSISPDSQIIASGADDNKVKLWNKDGTPYNFNKIEGSNILEGHTGDVTSIIFAPDTCPDNYLIASTDDDKTIRLWDKNGNLIRPQEKQKDNSNKGETFWNSDGEPQEVHDEDINSVSISPDCQKIATGGNDDKVKLWNLDGTLHKAIDNAHEDDINSVSFSSDINSNILASASDDDNVKLWNLDGTLHKAIDNAHKDSINSVSFSPDGQKIASGSADNTLKLWDLDGELSDSLIQQKQNNIDKGIVQGIVHSVSFSPNSRIIASGNDDYRVKLWHREDGTLLGILDGHEKGVNSVEFSRDGTMLVSVSNDKSVIIWNLILEDLIMSGCKELRNNPKFKESDKFRDEINKLCDSQSINEVNNVHKEISNQSKFAPLISRF